MEGVMLALGVLVGDGYCKPQVTKKLALLQKIDEARKNVNKYGMMEISIIKMIPLRGSYRTSTRRNT